MTACILVVDDDRALCRALRVMLQHGRYKVHSAHTGEEGLSSTALISPDLVLLDLGLPDIDGVDVCRRIRRWSEVPIIVLSADDVEARKVAALSEGANDYVTKPFGNAELEARIRVALRHRADPDDDAPALHAGPVQVDVHRREARLDGDLLHLTAREFDLLVSLLKSAGRTCTHEKLLEEVWGTDYSKDTNYLHSYMHRLRQRMQGSGARIETKSGIGYSLRCDDRDAAPSRRDRRSTNEVTR